MVKGMDFLGGATAKLGNSLEALLDDDNLGEVEVALDDIEIVAQERDNFEDDDGSLMELGESLAKRQLQAIGLIRTPKGPKPYRLVFGERRVRAGRLKGLAALRAKVFELTPEEVEDARFAENIQRKNLTQLEEAKRLKRDLDHLGSVEKVLEKHHKSKSWLSKRLALLDLGPQAARLINENITADKEVINNVRTIEKNDPAKAKAAVDALKTKGQGANKRDIAGAAKREVKPGREPKPAAKKPAAGEGSGSLATPPNREHQEPGPVSSVFPAAPKPHARVLRQVFEAASDGGTQEALATLPAKDADLASQHLQAFFERGRGLEADRLVPGLVAGVRAGEFGPAPEQALAMAAFVQGFSKWPQLDLAAALEAVRSA